MNKRDSEIDKNGQPREKGDKKYTGRRYIFFIETISNPKKIYNSRKVEKIEKQFTYKRKFKH